MAHVASPSAGLGQALPSSSTVDVARRVVLLLGICTKAFHDGIREQRGTIFGSEVEMPGAQADVHVEQEADNLQGTKPSPLRSKSVVRLYGRLRTFSERFDKSEAQ